MKKLNLFFLVLLFAPFFNAFAASSIITSELPYGGQRIVTIPCTCTPPNLLVTVLDYSTLHTVPITLPLLWTPASVVFAEFDLITSKYLLGSYRPGYYGPLCKIGNPAEQESCVTLPYVGIMGMFPGTGTSGPGF